MASESIALMAHLMRRAGFGAGRVRRPFGYRYRHQRRPLHRGQPQPQGTEGHQGRDSLGRMGPIRQRRGRIRFSMGHRLRFPRVHIRGRPQESPGPEIRGVRRIRGVIWQPRNRTRPVRSTVRRDCRLRWRFGDLYVCDRSNDRVQVFGADGRFITSLRGDAHELSHWAKMNVSANPDAIKRRREVRDPQVEWRFNLPAGLVFDTTHQRLIVADTQRQRLQIYNKPKDYIAPSRTI